MGFDLDSKAFANMVLAASYSQISEKRSELFNQIDGDAFYGLCCWPNEMQILFWRKPIGDEETFKLTLFLLGNGCSPYLACQWVLTSTFWGKNKTKKTA